MNRVSGIIAAIERAGSVSLIDIDAAGQRMTATLVGTGADTARWHPGMAVQLLFSETEVALAKNLSGLISMRNRMPATVVAVERGQVLAKVVLDVAGHRIVSVITTRSSHTLALAPGERIEALVKANEMNVVPVTAPAGQRP